MMMVSIVLLISLISMLFLIWRVIRMFVSRSVIMKSRVGMVVMDLLMFSLIGGDDDFVVVMKLELMKLMKVMNKLMLIVIVIFSWNGIVLKIVFCRLVVVSSMIMMLLIIMSVIVLG